MYIVKLGLYSFDRSHIFITGKSKGLLTLILGTCRQVTRHWKAHICRRTARYPKTPQINSTTPIRFNHDHKKNFMKEKNDTCHKNAAWEMCRTSHFSKHNADTFAAAVRLMFHFKNLYYICYFRKFHYSLNRFFGIMFYNKILTLFRLDFSLMDQCIFVRYCSL